MSRRFILYLLVNALICGCATEPSTVTEEPPSSAHLAENTDIAVTTYETALIKFNYVVQTTGKIQAINEQTIASESSGSITSLVLANGIKVKKGQLLMALDTRALELKIAKMKESIFSGRLNYQSDLLSQESLLKNKSKGIRDTVYRKLRASVGLTDSEMELKNLQLEKQKSVLRAPFSGTVANVMIKQNQFIKLGQDLFVLYTHNDLTLEAKILETEISDIKKGQPAEVMPIAGNRKYLANVTEINPLVDVDGLILIKLKLQNTDGLLPGMNAVCKIDVPGSKCLVVPKSAVVIRNGKAVVFTVESGKAKWNYVLLGRDNGQQIEIKDGLKVGEKVIISNNVQLAHGSSVKEQKD